MADGARSVTVFAPATVANVACGFDVFGFCLDGPGDRITATLAGGPGVHIDHITGDHGRLSVEPQENAAGVAAMAVLQQSGHTIGVSLCLDKGIALSSGMGGSAASSVAGALAVCKLLELDWTESKILGCALEGERVAAGSPHADNAAPCLHGGFVLVRGAGENIRITSLPVPGELTCALIRPHVELDTALARKILPDRVPLEDAVTQWGNTAALVASLYSEDLSLLKESLFDAIAEPVRGNQIPGFVEVKNAAIRGGALGCSISGSGPAIFAICENVQIAEMVCDQMSSAFEAATNTEYDRTISSMSAKGARVVRVGAD